MSSRRAVRTLLSAAPAIRKTRSNQSPATVPRPRARPHIALETEPDPTPTAAAASSSSSSSSSDASCALMAPIESVLESDTKKWAPKSKAPPNWERQYAAIVAQRARTPAPVDSMGCSTLSDAEADPKVERYQILIGLMLSSQTKDQMTAKAMSNLRAHGLTIPNILATPEAELDRLIRCVGFHTKKAKYILETSKILHEKYNDDIPTTLEEMMALRGVGPKMSYLCLNTAFGKAHGIGVDVHVHRISNRLGWVKTTTPEGTRKALEDWLPLDKWIEVNPLLVGFGQTICQPVKPRCAECDLRAMCRSSTAKPSRSKTTNPDASLSMVGGEIPAVKSETASCEL